MNIRLITQDKGRVEKGEAIEYIHTHEHSEQRVNSKRSVGVLVQNIILKEVYSIVTVANIQQLLNLPSSVYIQAPTKAMQDVVFELERVVVRS